MTRSSTQSILSKNEALAEIAKMCGFKFTAHPENRRMGWSPTGQSYTKGSYYMHQCVNPIGDPIFWISDPFNLALHCVTMSYSGGLWTVSISKVYDFLWFFTRKAKIAEVTHKDLETAKSNCVLLVYRNYYKE